MAPDTSAVDVPAVPGVIHAHNPACSSLAVSGCLRLGPPRHARSVPARGIAAPRVHGGGARLRIDTTVNAGVDNDTPRPRCHQPATMLTPQGEVIVASLPSPQCWYVQALIDRDRLPLDLPNPGVESDCVTMHELEALLTLARMPGVPSGPH
jgi:hypothetical protein